MIQEISAALTSIQIIKEIVSTANEAKSERELQALTADIHSRLVDTVLKLSEVSTKYAALEVEKVKLEAEIAKLKEFVNQTEEYDVYTTDAGSTVYRLKELPDQDIDYKPRYICPKCHHKAIVSILQPLEKDVLVQSLKDYVSHMHCPDCETKFLMDRSSLTAKQRSENQVNFFKKANQTLGKNRGGW